MTSWIVGNWKLNPVTVLQATSLASSIANAAAVLKNCQVMIAPSFLHIQPVAQSLSLGHNTLITHKSYKSLTNDLQTTIKLSAQDVCAYTYKTGAFTGDISAAQLKDMGVQWVIIGHSERRQYHQDDNEILMAKIKHSLSCGIKVIFCIGESEAQYLAGETSTVLEQQLDVIRKLISVASEEKQNEENQKDVIDDFNTGDSSNIEYNNLVKSLMVAYEPIWAIGTGKVPSVEEVTKVHEGIRSYLSNLDEHMVDVPILYGGSVKPDNASQFASSSAINGVLVGGAALNADSFIGIAQAFDNK